MSLMQTNLEEVYKDYLSYKNYIQENSKKSVEELKKEVADKALKTDSFEEQIGIYFEEFGEKEILKLDFLEAQKKLYYTYLAYKELVEVPIEIVEEVKDFKIKTVFGIIDGKKEIVDRELYDKYKAQHLEHSLAVQKYNEGGV